MLLFILYDVEMGLIAAGADEDSVGTLLDVIEIAGFIIFVPFLLRDVRTSFQSKIRRVARVLRGICGCGCCCGERASADSNVRGSFHEALLGDMNLSDRRLSANGETKAATEGVEEIESSVRDASTSQATGSYVAQAGAIEAAREL